MDPRKREETLSRADTHYVSREYSRAFRLYQKLQEQCTPEEKLQLRFKVLLCQFQANTISWGKIRERAAALIRDLTSAIQEKETNRAEFEPFIQFMRQLRDNLDNKAKQKNYICMSAQCAIYRVKKDIFIHYADMMEIDRGLDAEAKYLDGLYVELTNSGIRIELTAKLAENIADSYRGYLTHIDDDAQRKLLLQASKKKLEQALKIWRGLASTRGEKLLSRILQVLEELFDLAEEETEEAKLFASIHKILASKELAASPATEDDDESKQGLSEEIQEHHTWFETVAAQLTAQQTEYVNWLRVSIGRARPSTEAWQKILDDLIRSSPKPVRRRLGADIYAEPSAAAQTPVESSSDSDFNLKQIKQ